MKKYIKSFLLSFFLIGIVSSVPQKANAQISVSFQVFYDNLSPYGNWVDNPDYGYAWMPYDNYNFTPYSTNGYWAYTDAGWTWVSNYSWGWAPFHYGRWFNDPNYGYMWIPGYEWGPGWVSWRRSEGYYGWTPIGPGISIDFAYSSGYSVPYNQWHFVRDRDFGRTNIYNYYVSNNNYTTIINNSTIINNYQQDRTNNQRYNAGPDRREVEKRSGRTFTQANIRETNKPGERIQNGELQVYRPRMEKNNLAGRNPAPAKVVNWKDVKPTRNKNAEIKQINDNNPAWTKPRQGERNDRPVKTEPVQPFRKDQPSRTDPVQPKRNEQPVRVQPNKSDQPVRTEPVQPKRNDQPVRTVPVQPRRNDQPVRTEPVQPKRNDQPVRTQPVQPTRKEQPVRTQPVQPTRTEQPVRTQPVQQQRKEQPARTQPVQQPRQQQPAQQPSQPQRKEDPAQQPRKKKDNNQVASIQVIYTFYITRSVNA